MNALPLQAYRTWLFDCDGVILNSNHIKTDAFHLIAKRYGPEPAERLVQYHLSNGGISRFAKVGYLFSDILERQPTQDEETRLLHDFANAVRDSLLTCEMDPDLGALIELIGKKTIRIVVSGGAQDELRQVFSARGLSDLFSAIYGSPHTKVEILQREVARSAIEFPAIFIGDSRLDYEAAASIDAAFIFVSHWSEFAAYKEFFRDKNVRVVNALNDLLCNAA